MFTWFVQKCVCERSFWGIIADGGGSVKIVGSDIAVKNCIFNFDSLGNSISQYKNGKSVEGKNRN